MQKQNKNFGLTNIFFVRVYYKFFSASEATTWFFLISMKTSNCRTLAKGRIVRPHSISIRSCIGTFKQIKFPKNIICNGKDGDKAEHLWRSMLPEARYWIKPVWGIGIGKDEGRTKQGIEKWQSLAATSHRILGTEEVITIKVTVGRKWKVRRKVEARSCTTARRYVCTFYEVLDWRGGWISRP